MQLLRASTQLKEIGGRHGATPEEVVIAWILGASPSLVPIPGAGRESSIESSVRAEGIRLDERTRRELEECFRRLPE